MIGKSATVGLPTALLLMKEEATVSVCHIFTDKEDTRSFCQDADIIISAAGCLDLIRADYAPGPGGGRCGRQHRPGRRHAWGRGL